MTQEQIKAAAKEYCNKKFDTDGVLIDGLWPTLKDTYIAGAESRQQEIDEIMKQLRAIYNEAKEKYGVLNAMRLKTILEKYEK